MLNGLDTVGVEGSPTRMVGLLHATHPKLQSHFYEEVGLIGTFDPVTRTVEASADLGVRMVRVGGGT